ncbi:MAG: ATP-binding cassette domain-containing protein [Dehalococcoidia bacterium]|nr:ATP-binding cassette domain-containing protein [Dehalococcoidia bacterium]
MTLPDVTTEQAGNGAVGGGPALELSGVNAYYAFAHVLQGINLKVDPGSMVALLGRNGAGKTTTLRSIMGILARRTGRISFGGVDLVRMPTFKIARLGVGYIPEERRIFGHGLTVSDNLKLSLVAHKELDREVELERVFTLFPILKSRLSQDALSLSGGEQQMLAIARALVGSPRLLLIDEPTQGLAPGIITTIVEALHSIRSGGVSILLVEQNAAVALDLADYVYIIDQGLIQYDGGPAEVRADRQIQRQYLGV